MGGDLYQDKPPLFFWLLAVCYTLFGSVKCVVPDSVVPRRGRHLFLIYDLGRRLVSREAGLAAALITVCTLQFLHGHARRADRSRRCVSSPRSRCTRCCAICCSGPAWGWYFIGGFAAGLGVFTKGVGFLPRAGADSVLR